MLTLGGSNLKYHQEPFQYSPSRDQDKWTINLISTSINKGKQKIPLPFVSKTILIDSGTSKLVMPLSDVQIFIDVLNDSHDLNCALVKGTESQISQVP